MLFSIRHKIINMSKMIPPEQQSNNVHRADIQEILNKFSSLFHWLDDGRDSMLDIGCGTGDIAVDLLIPILPKEFTKLTGCDRSEENIQYARKKHEKIAKVTFDRIDYGCDNKEMQKYIQANSYYYDHVTSFYCLHWIPKQKNLMNNIYDILRGPNSDCLLVFVGNNPIFESYSILSKIPKWTKYMQDVNEYVPMYHGATDTVKEFSDLLHSIGFTNCKIDIQQKHYAFDGYDICKGLVKNINPFLSRVPISLQDEYLTEYANAVVQVAKTTATEQNFPNDDANKIIFLYKLIVVYAKK